MIAYEELERALTRWKGRRAGGADASREHDADAAIVESMSAYQAPDSTGEIDLGDAVVDEA
jgi:hypothetical protein